MANLPILIYPQPILYKNVTYTRGDLIMNVGPWAKKLEMEHALQGGFWTAQWDFAEDTPHDILASFWNTPYLMYEVVIPGAWEGVIWGLEHDYQGESAEMTVQDIFNCIRIAYTDKDSVDQVYPATTTGADDTSLNAATMTNSAAAFTPGGLEKYMIKNTTDGSWGIIRTNTATVITPHAMIGGTNNNWNNGDNYEIGEYICDWYSIMRFGRREERLSKSFFDPTTAEYYVDRYLEDHAWATTNVTRIARVDDKDRVIHKMRVLCSGLVATANNRYLPEATVAPGLVDIDARIKTIVDNYCDMLTWGGATANTRQTPDGVENDTCAWDSILALTLAGQGHNSNTYCMNTVSGGKIFYHALTNDSANHPEVQYYWHGDRFSVGGGNAINKYTMRPGVIRNVTIGQASRPLGTYTLGDSRDRLPSYVTVTDDDDTPSMSMKDEDLRAELDKNLRWLEESQDVGKDL